MDNYIVSARKYRPTTFDDVVGQSAITSTLEKAIKNNHLAQALLFCGPRGVGKTTCARILAKAINMDDGMDPDEDFSFNIFELDAASNNSVDDIRNLIDQVRFSPQQGKFKVYIIDEVHMLSQAAFNAFLKTLEEPPAHAIFILATTEKHKIIPTILSRCQIFDFKRIQVSDTVKHLAQIAQKEGVTAEEEALHVIAEKADGALRDALSVFDRLVTFAGNNLTYKDAIENLNILDHEYYFRATDLILQGDMAGSMVLFNEVLENGFNGHEFINGLASHFRNLLMCQDAATVALLEVSERVQGRYLEQSKKCAPINLLKGLRMMNECDVQYRASKNQRLTVELAIMKMCAVHKAPVGTSAVAPEKKKSIVKIAEAETNKNTESVEEKQTETTAEPKAETSVSVAETAVETATPPVATPEAIVPNAVPVEIKTGIETSETPVIEATELTLPPEDPTEQKPVATVETATGEAKINSEKTTPVLGKRRLSRSNMPRISDTEKPIEEEVVDLASLPKDSFSEAELQKIWEKRVGLLFREKGGLLSSLTKNRPTLKDEHTIELKLDGKHQFEQLQENKAVLIAALRKDLNNFSLQLETPVEEVLAQKKAYTPKEIYLKMVEENPNLDKLRTELGLDLEY